MEKNQIEQLRFKNAKFMLSVGKASQFPEQVAYELAVAGKSNVGKSSFINFLANHGSLAKVSGTPGKTRLLNLFEFVFDRAKLTLVDLPGYGYAKVARDIKDEFSGLIEDYFFSDRRPQHVFLLVDLRHPPTQLDLQMVAFLYHHNIQYTIIATKADKLKKSEIAKNKKIIADALMVAPANIIAVSAAKKQGKDQVFERVLQLIESV